jgi:hypothetical protein
MLHKYLPFPGPENAGASVLRKCYLTTEEHSMITLKIEAFEGSSTMNVCTQCPIVLLVQVPLAEAKALRSEGGKEENKKGFTAHDRKFDIEITEAYNF